MSPPSGTPIRVAVIADDPSVRSSLTAALVLLPDVEVVAWADSGESLLVLDTWAEASVWASAPSASVAARLRERDCRIVVADPGAVVEVATLRGISSPAVIGPAKGTVGPHLAKRQREVLVAYVSGNEVLQTVARRLGMDHETLKTHLRRIRSKYVAAGRPAPTRRDLYVRAVEDGLLPPPSARKGH